jgi:phytoene dehydrogenase-like protein
MEYEVVVIGAGIGGLTAAAVLAKRGINVCLLERQSYTGGCAATVYQARQQFEPTHGLYCGWDPGGVYDRLFAQLGEIRPRAQVMSPAYVVRMPDGVDIPRTANVPEFEANLRTAFPECADAAIEFYRNITNVRETDLAHLSLRFRRFIDVQVQTFLQCAIDECSYELAAATLDPRRTFWSLERGAQSLIDTLLGSFKRSGGKLRLDSPVLRLAYGADGFPIGLDLLSGERVTATRAIISNLTIWDTFGKLVGPARTPRDISSQLKMLTGWGVYQMFLVLNEPAISRLPAESILILAALRPEGTYDPEDVQLVLSRAHPDPGRQTDAGRNAVLSVYTRAQDWFSFHEDHAAHEERDQSMLERVWSRLHEAMPELGDAVELIETATPQTHYEATRRRFGMMGRAHGDGGSGSGPSATPSITSPFPNLWLVGDTVADGIGIEGVVESAWRTALKILA